MTHAKNSTAEPESPKSFEQTLQRLEVLVAEMEKGELGLDEMLKRFEEGMKLAETCEKRLGETRIGSALGLTVIAIQKGEDIITNPPPDAKLEPSSELLLVGSTEQRDAFISRFGA